MTCITFSPKLQLPLDAESLVLKNHQTPLSRVQTLKYHYHGPMSSIAEKHAVSWKWKTTPSLRA
eukprot:4249727-Ditylum_brightwellii.AAC.1